MALRELAFGHRRRPPRSGRPPPGEPRPRGDLRPRARHGGVSLRAAPIRGGYLEFSEGSGTYVAQRLPEELLEAGKARSAAPLAAEARSGAGHRQPRRLSAYGSRVVKFGNFVQGPARAFQANRPALDLFPVEEWARVLARASRGATAAQLLGSGPLGYEPMREAVAGYLGEARGVRCESGQVAIVSGVQGGLELVSRLLLDPGSRAAMEEPGYLGARLAFEAYGARVAGLPIDGEGMVMDERTLEGADLVYVTPAHQFPTCVAMSVARRKSLLGWAASANAHIFEDDYDSEFRFSGRPLPALQGLDEDGSVIFGGSFSKVLFPSLRLGYLVLPPALVDPAAAALSLSNRHAPLLEQVALADFIREGSFGRHIRLMRSIYAERHAALMDCARHHLAELLDLSPVEAGLQTAAWLRAGMEGEVVAAAALGRRVEVTPIGRYARSPLARDGLLLGFSAFDPEEIERGCRELAAALKPLA